MILELALLTLGYTQPLQSTINQIKPPYTQRVNESVQSCESILARLKKGGERALLKLEYQINSIEEALAAFPPKGAILIPSAIVETRLPLSLRFYKYTKTVREWDIALLINNRGMPIELYYIKGKIEKEHPLVVPGDLVFGFYSNPLDATSDGFDLYNLNNYIRYHWRICSDETRQKIEKEFSKAIHPK